MNQTFNFSRFIAYARKDIADNYTIYLFILLMLTLFVGFFLIGNPFYRTVIGLPQWSANMKFFADRLVPSTAMVVGGLPVVLAILSNQSFAHNYAPHRRTTTLLIPASTEEKFLWGALKPLLWMIPWLFIVSLLFYYQHNVRNSWVVSSEEFVQTTGLFAVVPDLSWGTAVINTTPQPLPSTTIFSLFASVTGLFNYIATAMLCAHALTLFGSARFGKFGIFWVIILPFATTFGIVSMTANEILGIALRLNWVDASDKIIVSIPQSVFIAIALLFYALAYCVIKRKTI